MRSAILLSLLVATSSYAREPLDRFRPVAPVPLTTEAAAKPAEEKTTPADVPADDAGIGIMLRGIVLVSALPQVSPGGAPSTDGVSVEGLPLIDNDDFRAQLAPFLGKPISMGLVQTISAETLRYYAKHDRPVVSITSPEQDVTNGVVQFVITEARVGEIRVVGNEHFKSSLFTTRLAPGDPILMSRLEGDAAFYGRNPFRSVIAELTPGATLGETDITLRVQDEFPLHVFTGYDNSGVESTGENRLFTGLNYGNLFGLGQEVSYQFTSSDDFEQLLAHSGVWTIPLPWKNSLEFSGVYAESKPQMADGFNLTGESWQVGARYLIPLPKIDRLQHEISIGYDFKFTNNNLQFGGVQIFDTPVEISQFGLGYRASLPDQWGNTSLSLNGYWSPGDMSGDNNDRSFNATRVGSDSQYVYGTLGLDRVTRLPYDFTLASSAYGQLSDGNLQGTEQFLLGGYSTVRGYDELVTSGDRGFLIRNEVYTPSMSLLNLLGVKQCNDILQFLAFHDIGVAEVADALPGEGKNIELQSAGLGLRWQIQKNLAIRFDYGWQLEDVGLPDSSRAHLGVTASY